MKENNFPFLPLIIIFFLFTYGFSYELIGEFLSFKDQELIVKTFIIINLAIIFLSIGYFLSKIFFKKERLGFKFLEANRYSQLIFIANFFLIINFLNKLYDIIPSNLDQVIVPIVTIGCSILFYSIIKFKNMKNYLYMIFVFVTIFFEILSSSYVFPASLILIYFVIYFIVNRKIPVILILFFTIFFFTLHLFKK